MLNLTNNYKQEYQSQVKVTWDIIALKYNFEFVSPFALKASFVLVFANGKVMSITKERTPTFNSFVFTTVRPTINRGCRSMYHSGQMKIKFS